MVTEAFARRMTEVHGARGSEWVARLPSLIREYAERWSLTVLPPFEPLSYNYVAPAVLADGTQAVLKLGVPNPELTTEIEALRWVDGHGMARLLAANAEDGVLLEERLAPGTPIMNLLPDDEAATSVAAALMRQFWRPPPPEHPFPTAYRWLRSLRRLRERYDGGCGPFPCDLVEQAEALSAELLATAAEPVLLHGDLHHENILAAERQPWLAIDPKGIVGEPAFEVGPWLANPMPWLLEQPHPERIVARRVRQLSEELGIERERVRGWGLALAVLSACWTLEDHGRGWEPAIAVAGMLAGM